jgi:hypothetical protein
MHENKKGDLVFEIALFLVLPLFNRLYVRPYNERVVRPPLNFRVGSCTNSPSALFRYRAELPSGKVCSEFGLSSR